MGLEPTTSAVTGRRSNQLNYRTVFAATNVLGYDNTSRPILQYFFIKKQNFFRYVSKPRGKHAKMRNSFWKNRKTYAWRRITVANMIVRALLLYVFLMTSMKFMGKRQIGEMQMTEFITMMMLSELAVLPVTDNDIPLLHGVLPLAVISSIEVILSFIASRSRKFMVFMNGNPVVLMKDGDYVTENLKKTRISVDDVETQIRIGGYKSKDEVDTVILERTGKMSILPKDSRIGGGEQT